MFELLAYCYSTILLLEGLWLRVKLMPPWVPPDWWLVTGWVSTLEVIDLLAACEAFFGGFDCPEGPPTERLFNTGVRPVIATLEMLDVLEGRTL